MVDGTRDRNIFAFVSISQSATIYLSIAIGQITFVDCPPISHTNAFNWCEPFMTLESATFITRFCHCQTLAFSQVLP